MPKTLWTRIALTGLLCFGSALLWMASAVRQQERNNPAGWIVDRALPLGPQLLASIGALLTALAFVLGVAKAIRWILRR